MTYLLVELVPVAVFVAVGVAFWWAGQRAMRRRPESVVDLTDATYRPDTPATEPSPTWPSVR